MRCGRAQKLMIAAVDGELSPADGQALDRHVADCSSCRAELATTRVLLDGIGGLPKEATVSLRLEQATMRAMRHAAADETESHERRWWRMPALSALAVAASLAVIAVGLRRYADEPQLPAVAPQVVARPAEPHPAAAAKVAPKVERTEVARRPVPVSSEPPSEPPAALAARPDLFVELPILRHMEKLDHLEAIQATSVHDGTAPVGDGGERSNG